MVKSSSEWSTFPMSSIESKKHDLIKQQRPNMSHNYEFVQLDVFTRTPLTGNPLAIFTDGRGLTDQEMQAIAREMNLSETTFILPREPQVEAQEGKRVRIFTVEEELPFAGHPTLGTALYLHNTAASRTDEIVLDLNVGKIGVRFSADSNDKSNRVAGDVFGEMRQRDPDFGPTLSRDDVAGVLRGGAEQIASEWPSQIVSTGLPFAIVPHGMAKSDEQILIHQGVEARRPSEIFVRATREGEKVTNVRVGGYAVEVLRGTVSLKN